MGDGEICLIYLPFRKGLIVIIIISTKYKMPKSLKSIWYRIRINLRNCITKKRIGKNIKLSVLERLPRVHASWKGNLAGGDGAELFPVFSNAQIVLRNIKHV